MGSSDILNIKLYNISEKPSNFSFHETLEYLLLNQFLLIVLNRVYTHMLYFPVSRIDGGNEQL
jgi:hypothetical protein